MKGCFNAKVKSRAFSGVGKYEWTKHALLKMRYYGLSEQRVKRIIRAPFRSEEGVLEKAIAVMQPASVYRDKDGKKTWKQEIWAMYKLVSSKRAKHKTQIPNYKQDIIRIITAWRYPGVSKKRDPIPEDILREVQSFL